MKKIVWVSRHELTSEQLNDLAANIGVATDQIKVRNISVTWAATDNATSDYESNSNMWVELHRHGDIIAGVFPPVALEAMPYNAIVYSPVSQQKPELRIGDGPIPFVHVRWAKIN
jgi:hypothetical protein